MVLLVMATIITLWTESTFNSTINTVVWVIFFVDFLIRFILAKKKWDYIKANPFLIIAIIPLDQFFQIARIVRIFYLFRIKTIAKYYITPHLEKLNYRSLIMIASGFLVILLIMSGVIWQTEEKIYSFTQGIYVVFSHFLFFGHHLFIVKHTFSICLLTFVSVTGVVAQGLALQWGFTKVEKIYDKMKKTRGSSEVG